MVFTAAKKNYLSHVFKMSHKMKNKLMKIVNGNGTSRNSLTIAHWNMGEQNIGREKLIEAESCLHCSTVQIFL